jgi:hypothetical protein
MSYSGNSIKVNSGGETYLRWSGLQCNALYCIALHWRIH